MYTKRTLTGDLFGGLTAAVVALPLALAFGVQSGMGAVFGLYGAIILGMVGAIFGGTRTQISGPTGPMTVVSATIVAAEIDFFGSLEAALPSIILTFLLAGFFQIILGVLKIGTYIRYIPYPVISGFMSGVGCIIIISQIFPLLGHETIGSPLTILTSMSIALGEINVASVFLSLFTILTIYIFPLITTKIPATLVALFFFSVVTFYFGLNVPVIGDIPTGMPTLVIKNFEQIQIHDPTTIVFTALTLACLGSIDSLLTSIVADNLTHSKHDSNRELIGQGFGNVVSGLFGGVPGAGATIRTIVNIRSGGISRLSGIVHSFILFFILVSAGEFASLIPIPVLAGILITVGLGVIDYRSFKEIRSLPYSDIIIMLTVMVLTVFLDLLQAVAIGMVMAALWFMIKMSVIAKDKAHGFFLEGHAVSPMSLANEKVVDNSISVYVQMFEGPVFFGFAFEFSRIIEDIPNVDIIVLHMGNVDYIDQSGLNAFKDAIGKLKGKKIEVFICSLCPQPKKLLESNLVIPGLISYQCVFESFEDFPLHKK